MKKSTKSRKPRAAIEHFRSPALMPCSLFVSRRTPFLPYELLTNLLSHPYAQSVSLFNGRHGREVDDERRTNHRRRQSGDHLRLARTAPVNRKGTEPPRHSHFEARQRRRLAFG